MSRRVGIAAALTSALGLVVFFAAPALAETRLSVAAPGTADVGATVPVSVTVTEDGVPVAGAVVTLSRAVEFAGISEYVELASATTGEDGVASLSYVQRAEVESELLVEVADLDAGALTFSVASTPASEQIFRSDTGVDLPGLGGWALIVLIGGVWALVLSTVLRLRGIASDEFTDDEQPGAVRRLVPYLLPTVVAVVGTILVAVLVRNPATHGNLEGPQAKDRVPHSHVGELTPISSPGVAPEFAVPTGDPLVDGSRAFFSLGCASCHGLDAASGVVGGDVSDPVREGLDDFLKEVRRGPKGMPAYSAEWFTDEELAVVHAYLESLFEG